MKYFFLIINVVETSAVQLNIIIAHYVPQQYADLDLTTKIIDKLLPNVTVWHNLGVVSFLSKSG